MNILLSIMRLNNIKRDHFILFVIICIIIFSTVFAYQFPDFSANYVSFCTPDYPDTNISKENSKTYNEIMAYIIIFLFIGCLMSFLVLYSLVKRTFTNGISGKKKLYLVLATYFYIIIGFANSYFLITYAADSNNAHNKFFYYYSVAKGWSEETKEYMIKHDVRVSDNYAFQGIEKKLWSGVDSREIANNIKPYFIKEVTESVPVSYIFENVERSTQNQVIHYLPENKSAVYFDCLYLSTVTVTTLGYGDITPKWKLTKVLVSVEAILGQLLLAVGIASAFSEMPSSNRILNRMRRIEAAGLFSNNFRRLRSLHRNHDSER